MVADPGYDDKNLYKYSKKVLGIELVCHIERYVITSKKRLELVCFYKSALGQATIYSHRRISIEPMIEHIKSVFRIDPLSTRGLHKIRNCTFVCFTISANGVYNCRTRKTNQKSIKYMLGTI